MKIKERVRILRADRTNKEYADLLGVVETTVYRWMNGYKIPSMFNVQSMCIEAGITLGDFYKDVDFINFD